MDTLNIRRWNFAEEVLFELDGKSIGECFVYPRKNGKLNLFLHIDLPMPLHDAAIFSQEHVPEHQWPDVPKQRLGIPAMEQDYTAFADTLDFPFALLEPLHGELLEWNTESRRLVAITTSTLHASEGTALHLAVIIDDREPERAAAVNLGYALTRAAQRLGKALQEGSLRFARAEDDYQNEGTVPEHVWNDIQRLCTQTLSDACVGSLLEDAGPRQNLALTLREQNVSATLRITPQRRAAKHLRLCFKGHLPGALFSSDAVLVPERSGVWGFFQTLGETCVGVPELDDAFFISAPDDAGPLLARAQGTLLDLHQKHARIAFEKNSFHVDIRARRRDLAGSVKALLAAWQKVLQECEAKDAP